MKEFISVKENVNPPSLLGAYVANEDVLEDWLMSAARKAMACAAPADDRIYCCAPKVSIRTPTRGVIQPHESGDGR